MFFSKVEPEETKSHHDRKSVGSVSLSAPSNPSYKDCGFRKTAIYDVMRYPLILLNICCVNVPAPCVCGVKLCDVLGRPLENSEHKANQSFHAEKYEKEDTYKGSFLRRCPNSDHRVCLIAKTVAFVLLVLYEIVDNIRMCYSAILDSDKTDLLVLNIGAVFAYLGMLYLRFFNWHSCSKHLQTLFSVAFAYENNFGFNFNKTLLKRTGKIGLCFSLLYHSLQSLYAILSLHVFGTDEKSVRIQVWPYLNVEGIGLHCISTFIAISSTFVILIASGTFLFQAVILYVITGEFKRLHDELVTVVVEIENHSSNEVKFDVFMKKLRALDNLMDKSYEVIKHTVAAAYIFGFPKICLVLYGLISGLFRVDQSILMCWGVIETALVMLFTTILLAKLQSRARSVVDVMYAADWSKFSHQMLQKATLLTAMFNNKSFGMPVYDMFVVDWSTLLMVGGTLLTYSVVILQFHLAEPSTQN